MSKQAACNEECYQQVAAELNLPLSLVREIISIQSLLTLDVISSGAFESVTMPYLGKVRAKPTHVQQINERKGRSAIRKAGKDQDSTLLSA